MRNVLTLIIGVIFGTGIALSGMANPAKVVNFFDVAGTWDPSLAFVMGGALCVTFIGYRFVLKRPAPVYDPTFDIPTARSLDARLLSGAAIFGIGWGIAGFCPGGALPALGTLNPNVILFVVALIVGMLGTRFALTRAQSVDPTGNPRAQH
ncbi:YeeE/YedE family protein [Litoreibacter roseus]|uniref:Membrane protein n=1 Tax=Litoreibacter roseus TaxID=2601869 RepID=A0A6N6JI71_9RHOB|nr:YeeE/YedE family protein [Litoreibacter roseus]GFE65520.1 membrane protein [Litoreibacter roseus]